MHVPKKSRKKSANPITWREALDLFVLHLEAARRSKKTIQVYRYALQDLRDHLDEKAPRLPGEVTLQDLREFQCGLLTGRAARKKRPLSVSSVSRMTTTYSSFFSFLVAEERIERDPTLRLERPRKPERVPGAVLSVKEVERLLAAADVTTPKGLRDRALVELYYAAGLRLNEGIALDLADLNHQEREVTVLGKGDRRRVLPVTRSAWTHLVAYVERARPVLATHHDDSARAVFLSTLGRRMCQGSVEKVVRTLALAAKVKCHVSPHCLRRTFATHLLRNGVNIRHIQALLGHTNLNTTAVYLRLDAGELRRQILLHHPRERFDP